MFIDRTRAHAPLRQEGHVSFQDSNIQLVADRASLRRALRVCASLGV